MALDRAFDADTLPDLREAVLAEAAALGLAEERAVDVMLAVHELAANTVRHGPGTGVLAMRVREGRLYCCVSDAGPDPSRRRPFRDRPPPAPPWPVRRGHGLWMVQLTADQVTVTSGAAGSQVTAVFTLTGPPAPW